MKPKCSSALSLSNWIVLLFVIINRGHGALRLPFLLLIFHDGLPLGAAQNATAAGSSATENDATFNPTIAIIVVAIIGGFFLFGFFSVYIRQFIERFIQADNVRGFHPGRWVSLRPAARGLEASIIETFPMFLYSTVKTLRIGKQVLECSVCLNEFEDNETLRLIPKCCHVFHPGCIDAWLKSHDTCPLCRTNLVPLPGESVSLPVPDSAGETGQSSSTTPADHRIRGVLDSPDARLVNSVAWSNQSMTRRSMSTGNKLAELFSRSNSHGQPVEGNLERFTLRLPAEVHDQLVNRTSCEEKGDDMALPQARSPTSGYRTGNVGSERNYFYYERDRNGRLDRRPFSITPPHRTALLRFPIGVVGSDEVSGGAPKGLLQAIRSPWDRLFLGKNNIGERSSDHLRAGDASNV